MAEFDFDLFVIGAGSGGVRAGRIAASHGARVGIAEADRFGGTCVIRGCVPKKLFVYASRFADAFEDARGFGWSVGGVQFNWQELVAAKDKEITRLEGLYRGNLERHKVEIFHERAAVAGPNAVRLAGSDKIVTAGKILIATGGRPFVDTALPGHELGITSDDVFDLPELPKRIVIVGGGYIAVEFAGILSRLGVETTLLYRGPKILRGFDEDLRDGLSEAFLENGVEVILGQVMTELSGRVGAIKAQLGDGRTLETDQVMFATGRVPNIQGLGLDAAGVATTDRGLIKVDGSFQTSVPSIFAVGDVCNSIALTPVAIRDGHAFADTQFGSQPRGVDYDMIPTAVFSTPEIGTVGFSEADARERFGDIVVFKSQFRPMKATLSGRSERVLMKLIVARDTDKVVGCHILGEDAAEIVQMVAIAMRMGARKADFDATMALHPSAAEELVTMATRVES